MSVMDGAKHLIRLHLLAGGALVVCALAIAGGALAKLDLVS